MIEGGGSDDDFAKVRRMACARPDLLQHLVDLNARAVTAYLNEQIRAGADAAMIFDTWGGLLTAPAYRRFSLATMTAVLRGLEPAPGGARVPTIVFTKGGGSWLPEIAACGADGVGLDWTVDLAAARRAVGDRVALQGNLDPLVLTTDPETVAREAEAVVAAAGPAPGHIFNLGHGIVPKTPPDNVAALVETVHRASRRQRGG
jgi:uroporphyrinogen decarboxylase